MRGKKKTGLEKRLMAYTAAAVGALAMAPAAEAVVHYSGQKNLTLNPQNPVAVDLNNDGITDFRFGAYGYASNYTKGGIPYSFSVGVAFLNPTTSGGKGGTGFIGAPGSVFSSYTLPFPTRLATGYKIQNSLQKYGWSSYDFGLLGGQIKYKYGNTKSFSTSFGNFNNATGCIGVRFNTDKGTRYGWIRYQGTSPSSGVIKDWAYEDTGGPIDACVVPEQAVTVPTLNQWGIMILIALLAGMSLKALKTDKGGQDA
jgi:hypothetical protein